MSDDVMARAREQVARGQAALVNLDDDDYRKGMAAALDRVAARLDGAG